MCVRFFFSSVDFPVEYHGRSNVIYYSHCENINFRWQRTYNILCLKVDSSFVFFIFCFQRMYRVIGYLKRFGVTSSNGLFFLFQYLYTYIWSQHSNENSNYNKIHDHGLKVNLMWFFTTRIQSATHSESALKEVAFIEHHKL